jgi:hypothetical protein
MPYTDCAHFVTDYIVISPIKYPAPKKQNDVNIRIQRIIVLTQGMKYYSFKITIQTIGHLKLAFQT